MVEQLRCWNPDWKIHVLDNASPCNRSVYVTHENLVNTHTGGGINDCLRLASKAGARYLLFIANDIRMVTPVRFYHFERAALSDPEIVQVSASITPDTSQARRFPWMVNSGTTMDRAVPHADLLLSLLDIRFIESFGGFPVSRGGWYFDWELAWHARKRSKKILITNSCVIWHDGTPQDRDGQAAECVRAYKRREAREVYRAKYGELPCHTFRMEVERMFRGKTGPDTQRLYEKS
jgi:GT2 family glycosyltransferase